MKIMPQKEKLLSLILLTSLMFGFSNTSFADNKFQLQERRQVVHNDGSGANNDNNDFNFRELEMLREELHIQLQEIRQLRDELIELKNSGIDEIQEEKEIQELKEQSRFIGVIDGIEIYQDKESREFFNLNEQQNGM